MVAICGFDNESAPMCDSVKASRLQNSFPNTGVRMAKKSLCNFFRNLGVLEREKNNNNNKMKKYIIKKSKSL